MTPLMYLSVNARHRTTQNAESGMARSSPSIEWNTTPQKKKLKITPA